MADDSAAGQPQRLGWFGIIKTVIIRLIYNEGLERAGYMAFMALFAVFPFLIFMAALAGFLGDASTANDIVEGMFRFLPANVASVLTPPVLEVMNRRSGDLLTFGVLATLWTSSSGVEALRDGLNKVYGCEEGRSFLFRRFQAVTIVVLGGLMFLLLSIFVILGPALWALFDRLIGLNETWGAILQYARFVVSAIMLFFILVAIHRVLPNHPFTFRHLWPGAALSTVAWLAAAWLSSLFLGGVESYSAVYGSLGGAMLILFFFYISAAIVLAGAEFNAVLREQAKLRHG